MTTSLEQAGNPWAEVARLQHQVQELTAKVEWYEAQIRLARARQFGASHEHSDTAQLHLFNEAEQTVASALEASTDPVATPRPKKTPGHRDAALAHLPVERIEYHLPESDQVCTVCQGPLHAMSAEVRRELQVIPAQVKIIEHVQAVYACRQCEREALTSKARSWANVRSARADPHPVPVCHGHRLLDRSMSEQGISGYGPGIEQPAIPAKSPRIPRHMT